MHARFLLFPPLFLLFLLLRLRRDGATRRQYIAAITPLALLLLGLEVYTLLLSRVPHFVGTHIAEIGR